MKTLLKLPANNRFFYTVLAILGIWHLWSLPVSPLPWFDETFFASITNSVVEGKGFQVEVQQLMNRNREILLYGPVYFWLTSIPVHLFGLDILSFRIVNVLFGALLLGVFYKMLRELLVEKTIARWLVLFAVMDVIFIQNAHSGRMEMVALFFVFSAFWFYFRIRKKPEPMTVIWMALAGILAFLTTPRVLVLVFPLFGFAVVERAVQRRWIDVLVLLAIPVAVYGAWVFYAYGSIEAFLDYYLSSSGGDGGGVQAKKSYTAFLGGRFYVPFYQWPLLLTGVGSAVWLIWRKIYIQPVVIFLLTIATYYLVVKDTGGYSVLIVLCWYSIIAMAAQEFLSASMQGISKAMGIVILAGVLAVNSGIFVLKATTIVAGYSERNPRPLNEFVSEHVSSGMRVVGDDRYYYACMRLRADYRYIDRPKTDSFRAEQHAEGFKPDYLFISTQTPDEVIAAYREHFEFQEEYIYQPTGSNQWLRQLVDRLPLEVQSSYAGRLIKIKPRS